MGKIIEVKKSKDGQNQATVDPNLEEEDDEVNTHAAVTHFPKTAAVRSISIMSFYVLPALQNSQHISR
ncbi:unnamed protein product [Gongylonema pulchrum]|uniref:Ovule protein n=1 Tax=Gongylonema pulchrum TaxID=637853 RepID=A0A183CZQ9_9BILA|nr:unnamed protein product [Gongylonema pulchrum]